MPLHSSVHVDRPLSNFAVEYRNADFIADMISPFVPVVNKSDSYFVFTQKDKFTLPETIRGPKDAAKEVTWSSSTDTYACVDHALRDFLSDALVANSDDPVKPRQRTTNFLTDLLLLDYERTIATLTQTAGNYGGSYRTTLTGGDQWSSLATSDPVGVVDTGKAAMFMPPNTMLLAYDVYLMLKKHPQILDRIKGGADSNNPALVGTRQLAEVFEVDNVLVGKAKYNSANKAQTASFSYVWSDSVVLAYVDPNVSLESVSAFKTFRMRQVSTDLGYQVRTYRDESLGGGGEWIEVETSYDEVQVCSDLGYLIVDTLA